MLVEKVQYEFMFKVCSISYTMKMW